MIRKKTVNKGALAGFIGAVAVLALVIILENTMGPNGQLFTVLKKGAVYTLVAVSMNLLNGFTGLFSLGQAGFMLLGAYTYAILTVPVAAKDTVYYLYGGSAVKFSLPDIFYGIFGSEGAGGMVALTLGVLLAIILGGLVAAIFAYLIGLPVLRLKSDYLAIATLGFAEIIRAIFQWQALGPVTNGANMITQIPIFSSFNIKLANGGTLYLSTAFPILIMMICLAIIVMLINSSYGRAFKAIREDEIAAESAGVNTTYYKLFAFVLAAFIAGVAGGLYANQIQVIDPAKFDFNRSVEILIMVVLGGMGSITGSIISATVLTVLPEMLRGFDEYRMLLYSIILIAVMLFKPSGLLGRYEISVPGLFMKLWNKLKHPKQKTTGEA
mgnify:CR=1 FL=1